MLSYALVNVRAPLASGKSNSKPPGAGVSSHGDASMHRRPCTPPGRPDSTAQPPTIPASRR